MRGRLLNGGKKQLPGEGRYTMTVGGRNFHNGGDSLKGGKTYLDEGFGFSLEEGWF